DQEPRASAAARRSRTHPAVPCGARHRLRPDRPGRHADPPLRGALGRSGDRAEASRRLEGGVLVLLKRSATLPFEGLIWGYKLLIRPVIGPRCRYLPTCSDYALEALATHGLCRGAWLALRRLLRCHPWGGSGYDPRSEERRVGEEGRTRTVDWRAKNET